MQIIYGHTKIKQRIIINLKIITRNRMNFLIISLVSWRRKLFNFANIASITRCLGQRVHACILQNIDISVLGRVIDREIAGRRSLSSSRQVQVPTLQKIMESWAIRLEMGILLFFNVLFPNPSPKLTFVDTGIQYGSFE